MLQTATQKIKLQKVYDKILNLSPAFDETIVFLGMKGFRQDCLTHADKNGKILKELTFDIIMDSFAMLSET